MTAWKCRLLLRYFALDLSASDVAELTGLTHKTVNPIFLKIRRRLAQDCERRSPPSAGEVEVDESYFGARRVRGERGRGASGKTIVFRLLKRDGKVYTEIVPDCKKTTLQAIIRGRVAPEAVIHSSGTPSTSGSRTGRMSLPEARAHSNGIESFWSFAKRRLQKFNGISAHTFYLHLKEGEWRCNNRSKNLYAELLKLLRNHPL